MRSLACLSIAEPKPDDEARAVRKHLWSCQPADMLDDRAVRKQLWSPQQVDMLNDDNNNDHNNDHNNDNNTVKSLANMYEDIVEEHANGQTWVFKSYRKHKFHNLAMRHHHDGLLYHPLNNGGAIDMHPQ